MNFHRFLGFAAFLFLVSPPSSAQTPTGAGPSRPDYFFHENLDGSIIAADQNGTYHFPTFQAYTHSPFFQDHGMNCGSDQLSQFQGASTTADCSNSNTNTAGEYDPGGGQNYNIDVVFHVLRRNNGHGDVSDSLIASQIDVLNADFAGTGISFTHAGTTRSNKNAWYNDSGNYYNSLAWDVTRYLNIYTNQAGGNLGYAYVPSGGGVVGNNFDRVVLYWQAVGVNAPIGSPYDQGRTATHEVGHYLGLYHTFQGGCSTANSPGCYTSGDLICDTNPESSPFYGCGNRTTCSSADPTDNFMDYTEDLCMNVFTPDQFNRMRCTLANFRVDLDGGEPVLPGSASNPSPGDGSSEVSVTTNLSWSAGSNADSHDVYFGTGSNPAYQGNQNGTSFNLGTLAVGTTYTWRIDEVNGVGTTTGTLWTFTTEFGSGSLPSQATRPNPRDGRRRVKTDKNMSWTAGSGASSHDVYFGTTSPPLFAGNQSGTVYDPGQMAGSTLYYWRVDEVNSAGTTTGVIWSFTTR
jgi:hypothetical protein